MRNYNRIITAYLLQLIIVITLAGVVLYQGNWQIQTDLLSLLPKTKESRSSDEKPSNAFEDISQIEKKLFDKARQNVAIALMGEQALPAYHQLKQQLLLLEGFELVTNKVPDINSLINFYAPYKDNLLSDTYQRNLNNPDIMTAVIYEQLTQMANPFVSQSLKVSPRLSLADYLNETISELGDLSIENGILTKKYLGQTYYLMQINIGQSSLSVKQSQSKALQLKQLFSR